MPVLADERLARLLEIEQGAPLLHIDQIDYDERGRAVMLSLRVARRRRVRDGRQPPLVAAGPTTPSARWPRRCGMTGVVSALRRSTRAPASTSSSRRRARVPHGPLIEREAELELLAAAVDRLAAGGSGVVMLEAPAGLGKTALLEHARRAGDRRRLPRAARRARAARAPLPVRRRARAAGGAAARRLGLRARAAARRRARVGGRAAAAAASCPAARRRCRSPTACCGCARRWPIAARSRCSSTTRSGPTAPRWRCSRTWRAGSTTCRC